MPRNKSKTKPIRFWRETVNKKYTGWFYLLISPWLIGVAFEGMAALTGLFVSVLEWSPPNAPQWLGLGNFQRFFADRLAKKALENTLLLGLVQTVLAVTLALVLAGLFNHKSRIIQFAKNSIILPLAVPAIASSLAWGWVFNPKFGIVNDLLGRLGLAQPRWLNEPSWAFVAIVLIGLWTVGSSVLVYLAALGDVPNELLEAAKLDGAGVVAQWQFIILPNLAAATLYLCSVNLIGAFQVFTPLYVLTKGGPDGATLTLGLSVYQAAFNYANLGYASAIGSVLLCLTVLVVATQWAVGRRWVT
jgi:multiple sugar transport system permease protein